MDQSEEYKIWYKRILFLVQISTLIGMIIVSIANITIYKKESGNLPLWTALLGTSLGYLLPSPKFKINHSSGSIGSSSIPSSIVS